MNVLCVCTEGNNRSVHIAHLLRYKGHDTLSVGARTSGEETRKMLAGWADKVIVTEPAHLEAFPNGELWPIADEYPRPFNPTQHQIVRDLIARSGL